MVHLFKMLTLGSKFNIVSLFKDLRIFSSLSKVNLYNKGAQYSNDKPEEEFKKVINNAGSLFDIRFQTLKECYSENNALVEPFYNETINKSFYNEVLDLITCRDEDYSQIMNLIVRLVAKMTLLNSNYNHEDIKSKQNQVANINTCMKLLIILRRSIKKADFINKQREMNDCNKYLVLFGDFLFTQIFSYIKDLRNTYVSEILYSQSLDIIENMFLDVEDVLIQPIPYIPSKIKRPFILDIEADEVIKNFFDEREIMKPFNINDCLGIGVREWTLRNIVFGGRNLGKNCMIMSMLAKNGKTSDYHTYRIGMHVFLSWKMFTDICSIYYSDTKPFSLTSAPVMFALQEDDSLYSEIVKGAAYRDDVNYDKVRNFVKKSKSTSIYTKSLLDIHKKTALEYLEYFPSSDVKTCLKDIILAMKV